MVTKQTAMHFYQHFPLFPSEQPGSLSPTQEGRDQRGLLLGTAPEYSREGDQAVLAEAAPQVGFKCLHCPQHGSYPRRKISFTHLVTFGTRNTNWTLRIRKRKTANELKLIFL